MMAAILGVPIDPIAPIVASPSLAVGDLAVGEVEGRPEGVVAQLPPHGTVEAVGEVLRREHDDARPVPQVARNLAREAPRAGQGPPQGAHAPGPAAPRIRATRGSSRHRPFSPSAARPSTSAQRMARSISSHGMSG